MKTSDLTTGSIPKHLIRLTAPLIAGNILQQLYNTVDALVLSRFAGAEEFAAIGVAGSVMNLFLFAIVGACIGISVLLAQFYGAIQHLLQRPRSLQSRRPRKGARRQRQLHRAPAPLHRCQRQGEECGKGKLYEWL